MVATLSLAACRPDRSPDPPDARPDGKPPAAKPDAERSLADRIDPGAVPGMGDAMPSWALDRFASAGLEASPDALATLLEQWRKLPSGASVDQRFNVLVAIGLTTIALERGDVEKVDDPRQLGALATVYGMFDIPGLVDPGGIFAPTLTAVATALTRGPDGNVDDARAAAMLQWLSAALGRLPALHRRAAARLLRAHPDHPELASILERVAATSIGDPRIAVDLRRHALGLRGRSAAATHHNEMAYACYAVLDVACGDAELAAAKADPARTADDITRHTAVELQRTRAQRAIALEKATSVDERIERARLLSDLGDRPGALAAFEAVAKDHPNDARPLAGAIGVRLSASFDVETAYRMLTSAPRELEHRDRAYLELAIGVRCMQLGKTVIPALMQRGDPKAIVDGLIPEFEPVRRDVTELAKLGVDKGVVLAFLFALSDDLVGPARAGDSPAMIEVARKLLPRALELRRQLPASPYAYDVMLAAAQFSPDRKAVLEAIAAPPPVGDDVNLAMRAAMTRLTLALQFEDRPTVAAVAKQVERWPDSFGAGARSRALARVDAVAWRLGGDAVARDRAISRYGAVLTSEATAGDLTDVANFAVLLADAGRLDEAKNVLLRGAAIDSGSDLIRLHRAAMESPADRAALEAVVADGDQQMAISALQWLAAIDPDPKQRAAWQAKLEERRRESSLRVGELPNANGLGASASLNLNVGYSQRNGLELVIDAGPVPRLYLQPPAKPKRGRSR